MGGSSNGEDGCDGNGHGVSSDGSGGDRGVAEKLAALCKERDAVEEAMQAAVDDDDFDEADRLQGLANELAEQIDALETA